jgi:hypothetical protein
MRMTDEELIAEIEAQRSLMIAVATGGPRIQEVNGEYVQRRNRMRVDLQERGLADPNPHGDLWAWYGRWSAGDLPSWQSRRVYVGDLYNPLIDQIRSRAAAVQAFEEPTAWERVDRGVYEIRRRLEQANAEEQFQAVNLLCREVLTSIAQVVYDPNRHPIEDGVVPSESDAKRMLDAFIGVELAGGKRRRQTACQGGDNARQ